MKRSSRRSRRAFHPTLGCVCCPLLCPVSPSNPGASGSDGWASLDDAPIPVESKQEAFKAFEEEEEEIESSSGDAWQVMKGLPEPIMQCKAEVEKHNLIHLPYKL